MSTAATAAYQAAQVESGIWLSESSTPGTDSGEGDERREPHLNTLACIRSLARSLVRFPHPSRERVCVSPRLCSLARDSRVFPRFSCASVIMCSHIGVPERSTEGDESPVDPEEDRTSCIRTSWMAKTCA